MKLPEEENQKRENEGNSSVGNRGKKGSATLGKRTGQGSASTGRRYVHEILLFCFSCPLFTAGDASALPKRLFSRFPRLCLSLLIASFGRRNKTQLPSAAGDSPVIYVFTVEEGRSYGGVNSRRKTKREERRNQRKSVE